MCTVVGIWSIFIYGVGSGCECKLQVQESRVCRVCRWKLWVQIGMVCRWKLWVKISKVYSHIWNLQVQQHTDLQIERKPEKLQTSENKLPYYVSIERIICLGHNVRAAEKWLCETLMEVLFSESDPLHNDIVLCTSVEPDSPAIMINQVLASLHCRIGHYGTRRNQEVTATRHVTKIGHRLIMSWNDYGDCWRWIWLGGASQCHSCFSLENYNRLSSETAIFGYRSVRPCWVSAESRLREPVGQWAWQQFSVL